MLALSDGRGRFRCWPAPEAMRGSTAAQLLDYDNDGLLDLVAWSSGGAHVCPQLGGRAGWTSRTSAMPSASSRRAGRHPRGVAAGDLDGDGDADIVDPDCQRRSPRLANRGDRASVSRVQLTGTVSNRSGVGAKVQLRAGSLSATLETSAATPAVAPADVVFGLGTRPAADAVRVLWPSGILQAE